MIARQLNPIVKFYGTWETSIEESNRQTDDSLFIPWSNDNGKWQSHDDHVHVSQIVKSLATKFGVLSSQDPGVEEEEEKSQWDENAKNLRMLLGIAWERLFTESRQQIVGDSYTPWPSPKSKDNIVGHIDAGYWDEDQECYTKIEEIKVTWKKPHDIVRYWLYGAQIKLYCYLADVRTANLHILHVGSVHPKISSFELSFSKHELDEMWKAACKERDLILKLRKSKASTK